LTAVREINSTYLSGQAEAVSESVSYLADALCKNIRPIMSLPENVPTNTTRIQENISLVF